MIRFEILRSWWRDLNERAQIEYLVSGTAIILLCWIGPFQTRPELSLLQRAIYWSIAIAGGFIGWRAYFFFFKSTFLKRFGNAYYDLPSLLPVTMTALVTVFLLEFVFRGPIPAHEIVEVSWNVLGVTLAVTGVSLLSLRHQLQENPEAIEALATFCAKLPPDLAEATIYAIGAEDHYIRIYTDVGDALMAGNFGEAMSSVKSLNGARVHRSWWAADIAVDSLDRAGGKWKLFLKKNLMVPVSRNYRPEVRAKGWDTRKPSLQSESKLQGE